MKRRASPLLLAALLLIGDTVNASPITCSGLFTSRLHILETLNIENDGALFGESLDVHLAKTQEERRGLVRRWAVRVLPRSLALLGEASPSGRMIRLERFLDSADPGMQKSRSRMDDLTSRLYLQLYAASPKLRDYILLNGDQRARQRAERLVREELLRKGIRGVIESFPPDQRMNLWRKFEVFTFHFFNNPVQNWIRVPWALPKVQNRRLPADLYLKLVRDGYDAHALEFQETMETQAVIDGYNVFRRVYSTSLMLTFMIYATFTTNEELKEKREKRHEEIDEHLKILEENGELARKIAVQTRENLRQEALRKSLDEFRQRYGEDPTPAEAIELRQQIWSGL